MTSRVLIATLHLALIAAPADAATIGAVETQKLSNGLTLVLAPDPRAGAVDITVWYAAGTSRETTGKTGVTHVIEQLMFRGTAAGGEDYIRRIQRLGGTAGTESTPDYSSFFQTVPPEAVREVFGMEAARMTSLPATQADFTDVLRLVRLGRARAGNTPIVLGMQRLFAGAFEGHPYAWPAVGREEDLDAVTLEDCVAFHRAWYGPANAVVTVTGRFDPADVKAAARATFGRVAKRPPPKPSPGELPAAASRRIQGDYAFAGPSMLIGWRVPGAASDDAPALELLARCLSGYADAPLDRTLLGADRPAAFLRSSVELRRDAGLFYTVTALRAGSDTADVRAVETAVRAEIARVAREGVDRDLLTRARKSMRVARLFGLQRPRDRGQAIGRGRLLADDPSLAQQNAERLAALTVEDVRAAAERWLANGTPVTVWMLPAGGAR